MWISYPIAPSIDIFQSRDLLENVEGKTSIELLHKVSQFSSVSQPQIFWSPLHFRSKFSTFAIHIKHRQQYFNHKQCNKTLYNPLKGLNIFKTVILKDQIQ